MLTLTIKITELVTHDWLAPEAVTNTVTLQWTNTGLCIVCTVSAESFSM